MLHWTCPSVLLQSAFCCGQHSVAVFCRTECSVTVFCCSQHSVAVFCRTECSVTVFCCGQHSVAVFCRTECSVTVFCCSHCFVAVFCCGQCSAAVSVLQQLALCCSQCFCCSVLLQSVFSSAAVSVLQRWCSAAVGVLLQSMFCSGNPVLRLPCTSSKSGGPWSRVHHMELHMKGLASVQGDLMEGWSLVTGLSH